MRTKEEQAGSDANQNPGKTSQTGSNALHRVQKNLSLSDQGVVLYPEDIPLARKLIGESRYENAVRLGGIIEVA